MVDVKSLRLFVPRHLRSVPADLAGAVAMTVAVAVAVLAPVIRETPLRVPLGLGFVLFVPGYVVVSALFPRRGPSATEAGETTADAVPDSPAGSRISGVERVVLSVGMSLIVAPLVGVVLTVTPWGLQTVPFVVGLSLVTLLGTVAAAIRRWAVPEADRFVVPYRTWLGTVRHRLLEPASRADAAVNVLLVASILLAAGSVGYAATSADDGEPYSSVSLLAETEAGDLEFVDDDVVAGFGEGDSQEFALRLENSEHRTVVYTVVVVAQEAEPTENGTVVDEQREIERFETGLEHGERWTHEHTIEPTDDESRLVWLVYLDGDVPDEPSTTSAPYAVDLWLDPVGDANATADADG